MKARKPRADKQPIRIALVPIGSLVPNPRNPRKHARDQLDGLAKSLALFGQSRPILVRKANHMIIAGHGIWQAMREHGGTEIEVIWWDCDQATADKFMVADNRWSDLSEPDDERIAELLRGIAADELPALGFPIDFLAELKSDPIIVAELDTAPVADTFWISIRGNLKDQATALRRLQDAMSDLEGVAVELGTVLQ